MNEEKFEIKIDKEFIQQVFYFMNKKFGLIIHHEKGIRFVMSDLKEKHFEIICADGYFTNLQNHIKGINQITTCQK